jgi:molybdenum cofactor biosynthesis enzyme MoaA
MTTNGQFRPELLPELKEAGITSLNFSIHTIDPAAWSQIQQDQDLDKSKKQIARALSNVRLSVSVGIKTKVNIAVGDNSQQTIDLIDELRGSGVEIRLLSMLGMDKSLVSICEILSHYDARRIAETRIMGSSQYRMTYESTVGAIVVKDIFQYREITVCKGCTEKCEEGFYGIRLIPMGDQMYARLCVHKSTDRTMMSLADLRTSIQLAAIKESSGLNATNEDVNCHAAERISACGD